MSRLGTALEGDGLAVREPHAKDGRALMVHATAEGRRILERGRERRIAEVADLLEGLTSDELAVVGEAARLVEQVPGSLHPLEVRMLGLPRKGGGPA